jgi:phosphoglycolate phosphatase
LNHTLEEEGLPCAEGPEIRFAIGDGVLPLLERICPERTRDTAQLDALYMRFRDHYQRVCLDTTELYEGVASCLDRLADATLVVASNKPARFLVPMLGALGIEHRFAAVIAGDSLEVCKPDPTVWAALEARAPGDHGSRWMIGDSAIDVATGAGVGATTIGCAWGLRGPAELRGAGADHIVEHPSEIANLILERLR